MELPNKPIPAGESLLARFGHLSTVESKLKKSQVFITETDPIKDPEPGDMRDLLMKSILHELKSSTEKVESLAFEIDPNLHTYNSVYVSKRFLIPDAVLKKILIQDDLVAAIIRARETQVSSFGRPRYERHSTGYVIEPMAGVVDGMAPEEKKEFHDRIKRAVTKLSTCGSEEGYNEKERMSLSEYLMVSTRNAVGLGRIATEILRNKRGEFHSFRPRDVATIFHAVKEKSAQDKIREEGVKELARIKKKKPIEEQEPRADYAWIQVIEGVPRMAFTDKELFVYNFYPVIDVELLGYPVTPIDTMFSAISTHINIVAHNRLYFQTGRAARGCLVFKSDDIGPQTLERIKQQFNASINGVGNSWRMPVFGIPGDGEIEFLSIDSNTSRDAEFTYLIDSNARVILSAFQMSPDELPGWSYLSKGTNSQALSEGNQEFRIEAGRDQGIRPLLQKFEDFINTHLFPLIDKDLSKQCRVRLIGLDADTEEKEAVRLIQDAPLHMTYDEILEKVEKPLVGKEFGGAFPINPQFQAILDKIYTVGEQKAKFTGDESARLDKNLQYYANPFWFQWMQLQMAMEQAQAAAQAPQPPGGQGEASMDGNPAEEANMEGQAPNANQAQAGGPQTAPEADTGDLTRSMDQAVLLLSKSEKTPSQRKLLSLQKQLMAKFRKELKEETELALNSVLAAIK